MREPRTPQGAATQARIVEAAAELISRRGVAGTTLDDVRAATATSKSQLYHYFDDKAGLVLAVIDRQRDVVLAEQRLTEEPLDSLDALNRWRYRTLAAHRRQGPGRPCPLGRLAAELTDDDAARAAIHAALEHWREQLATGLRRMVERGTLRPEADPTVLAGALLGAVQGGRLLAATARDAEPLRRCLDTAIAQVAELTAGRTAEVPRVPPPAASAAGTT